MDVSNIRQDLSEIKQKVRQTHTTCNTRHFRYCVSFAAGRIG